MSGRPQSTGNVNRFGSPNAKNEQKDGCDGQCSDTNSDTRLKTNPKFKQDGDGPKPAAMGKDDPGTLRDIELECEQLEIQLKRLQLERKRDSLLRDIAEERALHVSPSKDKSTCAGTSGEVTSTGVDKTSPPGAHGGCELAEECRPTGERNGNQDGDTKPIGLHTTILRLKSQSWAESTKRTYTTHLRCLSEFCNKYRKDLVPLTTEDIALYIAFLVDVKQFKYSTIKNYLRIISHLHLEGGLKDPLANNWHLTQLLMGVKREVGRKEQEVHSANHILKENHGV